MHDFKGDPNFHRRDPVFAAGQAFGLAIYVRNLVLISRGTSVSSAKRAQQ